MSAVPRRLLASFRRAASLTLLILLFSSCAVATAASLPYLIVAHPRLSPSAQERLSRALGLRGLRAGTDGVPRFFNANLFGALPMNGNAFDFSAISHMRVLTSSAAVARTRQAFASAGLLPLDAVFSVSHMRFGAATLKGKTVVNVPLDTEVAISLRIGKMPLLGPGAGTKIAYTGDKGTVAQLRYALPLVHLGPRDALISPSRADVLARQRLLSTCGPSGTSTSLAKLSMRRQLAYYAPAPESGPVTKIFPQYVYTASTVVDGRRVQLRRIAIPADTSHTPKVAVQVSANGSIVSARATVHGGTGPYRYSWSSCSTTLDPKAASAGPTISYRVHPRGTVGAQKRETLTLVVTDANGITTQATSRVPVSVVTSAPSVTPYGHASQADPVVATEWIGTSQGLSGSPANAGGFVSVSQSQGIPVAFNWGDDNVFESDFSDSSLVSGGDDSQWADRVDMLFYTGHANGNGFVTGRRVGHGFVDHSETRWGNNSPVHLNWLIVAACGPLQGIQTGDLLRWTDSFYGLHQLLGYATTTYDNTIEGSHMAIYSEGGNFGFFTIGAMRVRQAWAQAATDAQTPTEIWGTMGLYGTNGISDYNDFFPGRGPVGPDIPRNHALGYWWEWGTS